MSWQSRISLQPRAFSERETLLAELDDLRASTFLYDSGVHGLRLDNGRGRLEMLPFQGQQIWHAEFGGRPLTMRSMFDMPRPTREYLATYGGFLLHCGVTAMGTPAPEDRHPTHGELPNAPYESATLLLGEDDGGRYLGLTGRYRHTIAFNHDYLAEPLVKLYRGESRVHIEIAVRNLKRSDMELMYLAHVNFRPVDGGRLVYSARSDPASVRVRRVVPSHIHPKEGYLAFIEELAERPERHHLLSPGLQFDPEVVFYIDYLADADGWSHSLQVHPGGGADFISHRPDQLPHGVRWISRTPDQDCLGIVLPATAEPEGYLAEKAKGNVLHLPPGGTFRAAMVAGALTPEACQALEQRIEAIVAAAA